jgi:mannose-6-phosphate isomerase-like protein (cupin superfamily)
MKTSRTAIAAYPTKDGAEIRELMHPSVHGAVHGVAHQSLAEATVLPGQVTALHRHRVSEELYHVGSGTGRMTLGTQVFTVSAGDTVCIPPGTAHRIENTAAVPLVLLCMCAPAYAHEDTELLPDAAERSTLVRMK